MENGVIVPIILIVNAIVIDDVIVEHLTLG